MSYLPTRLAFCGLPCDGESFYVPPSMFGKLVVLREDRDAPPPNVANSSRTAPRRSADRSHGPSARFCRAISKRRKS